MVFISFLACFSLLCLLVHLVSFLVVVWRSRWVPQGVIKQWRQQGVTILRPVAGLENNLAMTLESTFKIDHENYEIIFCVAREDDPVIALCQQLMARYPNIPTRLLIGNDMISDNPKLNNLVKGWNNARFDWIVMTDSNVEMPSNYLERIFARWDDKTGLVVSPPLGRRAENFPAELEAAFLNSYQARWQLFSDSLNNGFAQGKTLFWRKDILEKAGGIDALSGELAEDAAATKIVRSQGLHVRLTAMPFSQPLGKKTLKSVWDRQLRWAKLRRDSFAFFFYLEILSGPLMPLIAFGVFCALTGLSALYIGLFLALWYGIEFGITALVGWPFNLRQAGAIIYRDIILCFLWLCAFKPGGYQWQGHNVSMTKK